MRYLRIILLSTVLCALSFASAQAEIVVYKAIERGTTVGNEFESSDRSQSFFLCSTALQRLVGVVHASSSHGVTKFDIGTVKYDGPKSYHITTNLSDYTVVRGITGGRGIETMIFRSIASTNSSGRFMVYAYFARGRDATLDLGNGTTVELPKTMKATTRWADNVLGPPYVSESSSTVQFQREDTRIANMQMETPEQTIERIRARLEAQGYVRGPNSL